MSRLLFSVSAALLLLGWTSSPASAQTSYPCSAESSLRSTSATTAISPVFSNQTSSIISIYWLNYSGQRVFYFTIAPGATRVFVTFLTHPWIVIDPSGNCLGIYIFSGSGQTAVVNPPAASQGGLQVSPTSLSFTAKAGAAATSQSLTVSSVTSGSVPFAIAADSGQPGSPAPSWLSAAPSSGTTPGLITVTVDPGRLSAASYAGRIVVTVPNDSSQQPIYVPVSVTVTSAPPLLGVAPASLSFQASVQMPGEFEQTIVVQNVGGGGTESFTVSEPAPIPWLETVAPSNGQATPNKPAFVQVRINTRGLGVGGYKGTLHFASVDSAIDVPVSLFVAGAGPVLAVDQTGLFYTYRQGQGLQTPQIIHVFDLGDPASTVSFTAEVANSAPWLSLSPASGSATAAKPGVITATINTQALSLVAANYYGLIRISDPQSQGSPQYVTVVLNVTPANALPQPDPFPRGLVFVYAPGGVIPAAQQVTVYTSSSVPALFEVSSQASAGSNGSLFVSAGTTGNAVSTAKPAILTITPNLTQLSRGVYQGSVNIEIGTVERSVNVTAIVLPPGNFSASRAVEPLVAGCTPTQVVLTQTGLPNGFSVPGGFPATLSVIMNDDCGNIINNGSVAASFSNGDPALSLESDMVTGTYSATWQPGNASPQTTVTVQGTAGTLTPGATVITGAIGANQAPVLAHHGTVNNLFPSGGLSPGVVAEVFGSDLASKSGSPGVVPLPTTFQGTSILVGSMLAPLFFVSGGQVNVQIPPELKPGQYRIIGNVNGALTLPDTVDINPQQPGVAAFSDGHTIAQHSDFSLVNSSHPAKPGEVLVIYLVGMGATNPPVASGQPAPSKEPLARVAAQPTLTVDGQNATVFFAGLTPGGVGLYQINFQVPKGARSGDLELLVTQSGVAANTTKLTVGK